MELKKKSEKIKKDQILNYTIRKTCRICESGDLKAFLEFGEMPLAGGFVKKEDLSKGIKPDSSHEKVIRSQAIIDSREKCFTVFDIYKKAHRMPSHASPFEPI